MMNDSRIDQLIKQLIASLPADLHQAKQDLENNFKSALQKSLAGMDLVTRDEYDIQAALLQRTREKLVELEKKVAELNRQLQGTKSD
jgi:BMFP domain-containing protein YqiC